MTKPLLVPFFISHLGCPHRCVFCNQDKIAGARSVLPTEEEILSTIERYRVAAPKRPVEVAFYGGTFTALPVEDQRRLLDPLQLLIQCGEVQAIRLSTRPDAVDAGTAQFLKEMRVGTVELGIQSMHPEVLDLAGRGHSAEDVERAFQYLQNAGISVGAQLMPGLPGDSAERSLDSLDQVLALNPACLRIYPTLVLSGTELAERYRAGDYIPLSLDEAVSVSTRMLLAAQKSGVPVIRIGIQPTDELQASGTLLAGPFHPAFGQLVQSELCYMLLSRLAADLPRGSRATLIAPPGRTSDLVGQKRRNLVRLHEAQGVEVLRVLEDPGLDRTEVAMLHGDMVWKAALSELE